MQQPEARVTVVPPQLHHSLRAHHGSARARARQHAWFHAEAHPHHQLQPTAVPVLGAQVWSAQRQLILQLTRELGSSRWQSGWE